MLVTQFLQDNFGLPAGGLYSNLIASAMLGAGGFIYGRAFEKRAIERHREQLNQKETHHREIISKLDTLHMSGLKGTHGGRK